MILLLAASILVALIGFKLALDMHKRAKLWRVVIKPGDWHYTSGKDAYKTIHGMVVYVKRGATEVYIKGLDQRDDDFSDELADAMSKAEWRARELNGAQKMAKAALK